MKNKVLIGVVIAMLTLMLAACGGGAAAPETGGSQPEAEKPADGQSAAPSEGAFEPKQLNISLAGGSAGGSWSAIGEGIGETIRRLAPGSTFTYEPGQDGANAVAVAQGTVPFGMAHSPIVSQALKGEEPFPAKLENLRMVASLYQGYMQIAVRADAPFTTIEEIVEKKIPVKVSMNKKGTIQNLIAETAFAHYGVTPADIESWGGQVVNTSSGDSMDMIRDNRLDMYITTAKAGETYLVETNLSVPLRLIQLSDEVLKELETKYGMPQVVMPANSYDFQPEAYKSVELYTSLITSAEVDEATVYQVTKSIVDNLDYLKTIHDALSETTPEALAKVGGMPMHPGAEKLYKEVGALQ